MNGPFCGELTAHLKLSFEKLCFEELSAVRERDGIGLLAEKRLHGVLKRWVADDRRLQEVRVSDKNGRLTRFVADVLTPAEGIFEIQTASLYPLKRKLDFYMAETDYPVTVVHPLVAEKWVNWISPETGEIKERHRSPRHDGPLTALTELKAFLPYLGSPRLNFLFPYIAFDEYRLLDGIKKNPKRRSHRYELIPLELRELRCLSERSDFAALFPAGFDTPFTAKSFGKSTRLRGYDLYDVLAVFEGLGVIRQCGRSGRARLWERV